jgi:predicted CXXCH cytochrome family protein
MRSSTARTLRRASLLLVPLFAAGCVDERIVYEDVRFPPLPVGAAQFVGYSDQDSKRTVCGNCHVGQQSDWVTSAHADAFATLQASPGAQTFCEGCHTVGQLGNPVAQAGGWETTGDTRYHDVQCESCHGPGLTHIENPDIDANVPHAALSVGVDLDRGCGECHSGAHHPFVDEWSQSAHAQVRASPAGNPSCKGCHTGEDALLQWGIRDDYAEKEEVLSNPTAHLPITCGVCHDPHSGELEGQLRFPIDEPSEENNLCMKCHHKRGTPDPTTFRGPHSPEGPVLLGYAGWWPPTLEFAGDTITATHGSDRNPRLCAGCHVNSFTVTDQATGQFQFQATGHLFAAIPCLDANGIPGPGDCGLSQRTFQSCTASGCHSEVGARAAYTTAELRIQELTTTLRALLAQVPASEFVVDNRYTSAEGARFNAELGEYPGTAIHNPFLIEALLIGSIQQIRAEYGVGGAQSSVRLERLLGN